jgi:CheY-like chemotaxis protein
VQRVALADVLEASYETVHPAADAKGVRIRKVIDPLAGPVSGDPNRLQQIIWNLLNNAVKFTPRGGRVDLLLERVNSHVEVTVHDTGDGIAPEFLPHVFDRFRQADGTTTRRHGGLGLGLSIVKHLVELHGGSVRAKSPGIGQGSTFVVELPVAPIRPHSGHDADHSDRPRHPSAAVSSGADECYPRLDGVTVLVVDDDFDARELMRRVLSKCGAEVVLAAEAKSALSILQKKRPRVMVSDIGMPTHDGYELIRWIRALPEAQGGRTPAIALTAFARSEDRRRAIAAGYQTHLAKPADTGELVTVVGSLAGVLPT